MITATGGLFGVVFGVIAEDACKFNTIYCFAVDTIKESLPLIREYLKI